MPLLDKHPLASRLLGYSGILSASVNWANGNKKRFFTLVAFLGVLHTPIVSVVASEPLFQLPQWKITADEAMNVSGGSRLQLLNRALEEAKALNQADGYPQSECLFELAIYYTDIGKTSQAELYFREAADLKSGALKKIMTSSSASSSSKHVLPAYSNALQEHEGKVHDLANSLSWLGRTYFREKKYEDAALSFNQAIELLNTDKDPDHEAILLPDTLLRAARVERLLNHLNEAKKLEERARYILSHRRLEVTQ